MRILLPGFRSRCTTVGGQTFIEDLRSFRRKNYIREWWNNDAKTDEIKSAAAISKQDTISPFVKLPDLPGRDNIKGKIICDLGCGYGRVLIPLAKFQPKMAIGIDISEVMLQKCIQYANREKVKLVLIHSPLPKIPLKSESVDLIYSSAVILHLDKGLIGPIFREMERVLKPGGKLVLQGSFPNSLTVNALSDWLPSSLKSKIIGVKPAPGMPKFYTYWELDNLLRETRLRYAIRPNLFHLAPLNINRFRLPFVRQIKQFNNWFNVISNNRKPPIVNHLLANYFDVEGTKSSL